MHRLRFAGLCSRLCSFVLLSTLICTAVYAQNPGCPDPYFATLKQQKVSGINIPGNNNVHGYVVGLPDDYASTTKKYPLLLFFHGAFEAGDGSASALCNFFPHRWFWNPPVLWERTSAPTFPTSVTAPNGQTYKFILISPQVTGYSDPNTNLNAMITYFSAQYRVDPSMIYLTGLSAGADYIQSYAGYSDANAQRVAGILPVAVCSNLSTSEARVIAKNSLAFWATKCSSDDLCTNGQTANQNAALINAQTPATTVAAHATTWPLPGQSCDSSNFHNVWNFTYDPSFVQLVNGQNVNVYQWMVSNTRAANLPVKLESYSVTLRNEKVYVQWATTAESNNGKYTIERSADGKQFKEIGSIAAVGNNNGKSYQYTDVSPLSDLSYYRLVQTDLDGRKEIFAVKKVLNRVVNDRTLIIGKNPFTTELSAYINVARTQAVTITLADINGRIVKTQYDKYAAGMAEINLNTSSIPKGVYFLKVKGEDFVQTQKVVKQ